jgi:hypothetical protein
LNNVPSARSRYASRNSCDRPTRSFFRVFFGRKSWAGNQISPCNKSHAAPLLFNSKFHPTYLHNLTIKFSPQCNPQNPVPIH